MIDFCFVAIEHFWLRYIKFQICLGSIPKNALEISGKNRKKVSDRSMTRGIYLPSFAAIGRAVLALSWGQVKICPASVAWWLSPMDTKMGTKIFSQTYRLTMCGLKKLASGFSQKVEKCWQNSGEGDGGGGNGPKQLVPLFPHVT